MASSNDQQHAFVLPKEKQIFHNGKETDRFIFYDVKFYPYSEPSTTEPVFAAISQKKVYIGRLSATTDPTITMLHELEDEQESRQRDSISWGLNSCSWCYIDQRQPLLAVAGSSGQIKIIDAVAGERFTTFIGHGNGTVNDIATHPLYPWCIATASMDKSIRIWDLRRYNSRHDRPQSSSAGKQRATTKGF